MRSTPMSARARSSYDQGTHARALAGNATRVLASRERLPFATFTERQVLTMTGWDVTQVTTVATRDAARARLAEARATFHRTTVR